MKKIGIKKPRASVRELKRPLPSDAMKRIPIPPLKASPPSSQETPKKK